MENVGPMNYVFNIKENRIEFYNTDNIVESDAQSFMDYDFTGKDIEAVKAKRDKQLFEIFKLTKKFMDDPV
jgi:hypothetical protein